jgi:hypothetical protein
MPQNAKPDSSVTCPGEIQIPINKPTQAFVDYFARVLLISALELKERHEYHK